MMKQRIQIVIVIACCMLACTSCGCIQQMAKGIKSEGFLYFRHIGYGFPDEKNRKLRESYEEKYKEGGNFFYITSTYSYKAVIWHYTDDEIIIDVLRKGKLVEQLSYPDEGKSKFDRFDGYDMDSWEKTPQTLDGDGLRVYIKSAGIDDYHGTDIAELEENSYDMELSKIIVRDIKKYKLNDYLFD